MQWAKCRDCEFEYAWAGEVDCVESVSGYRVVVESCPACGTVTVIEVEKKDGGPMSRMSDEEAAADCACGESGTF